MARLAPDFTVTIEPDDAPLIAPPASVAREPATSMALPFG